jgi:hypothetical protein
VLISGEVFPIPAITRDVAAPGDISIIIAETRESPGLGISSFDQIVFKYENNCVVSP